MLTLLWYGWCTDDGLSVALTLLAMGKAEDTSGIRRRDTQKNARILLVILFPRDTAAVTALDSRDFCAFNDSMCEA